MGRRPAARGLPWVRVVSIWDVMVSVWRPLGGRSKRLVSVGVPPCLHPSLGLQFFSRFFFRLDVRIVALENVVTQREPLHPLCDPEFESPAKSRSP